MHAGLDFESQRLPVADDRFLSHGNHPSRPHASARYRNRYDFREVRRQGCRCRCLLRHLVMGNARNRRRPRQSAFRPQLRLRQGAVVEKTRGQPGGQHQPGSGHKSGNAHVFRKSEGFGERLDCAPNPGMQPQNSRFSPFREASVEQEGARLPGPRCREPVGPNAGKGWSGASASPRCQRPPSPTNRATSGSRTGSAEGRCRRGPRRSR
jgi:hypothetical protein